MLLIFLIKYIGPENLKENNKFPKKVKWLYNQMRLYSANLNFCRDQRGLTKKTEN